MKCKACIEQGYPAYFATPPTCAFDNPENVALGENWQCATLIKIRALAGELEQESVPNVSAFLRNYEDQQASILVALPEGFLVMGWYKSRGRTEYVGVLSESEMFPFRLDQAEALLARLERDRSRPTI